MREQSRWAALVVDEGRVRDALLHVAVAALFAVGIAILKGSSFAWQFVAGYAAVQAVSAVLHLSRPTGRAPHGRSPLGATGR